MKFADFTNGQQNNLNLMRLIAATAVAFSHSYFFTNQFAIEPLFALTSNMTLGYLAVFIFFVISGFLVSQSYERSKSISRFIAARALRIYPALIVVLILSAYVMGVFFTTLDPSEYLMRNEVRRYVEDNILFKVNQSLPGVFKEEGINGSIWTLRYEVYVYFLLLVAGVSGMLANRAVFNSTVLVLLLLYIKSPIGIIIMPGSWDAVILVPVTGFFFGALVYVNRDYLDCKISYVFICIVIYYLFRQHEWFHLILVVTLGYIVLTLGFHKSLTVNFRIVNDYSYGIYLYAFPVQQAIRHSVSIQSPLLFFFLTMLITVPLAVMSWHFVEKPALKLKKAFVRKDSLSAGGPP